LDGADVVQDSWELFEVILDKLTALKLIYKVICMRKDKMGKESNLSDY
jgi:hypothetical protein